MDQVCEACEVEPATIEEPCDDPVEPYLLCNACLSRLQLRTLRPLEWYNLAKRHGSYRYLLHDDFYDDDRVACQPEEDVVDSELYPAPSFETVRHDPESLLDWCVSRWTLKDQEFEAWSQIPHEDRKSVLTSRFSKSPSDGVKCVILEVIGNIGDVSYADFVKFVWSKYPDSLALGPLAEASVACLPFSDGFQRVTAALAALEPSKRRDSMNCLGYFESHSGLDWIEENFFEPATESWGYLAASCRPSWARITKWLARGRPLSLVAIDTLRAITRIPTPFLKKRSIQLLDMPTKAEMERVLLDYINQDPVPRVEQRVKGLLLNTARITRDGE